MGYFIKLVIAFVLPPLITIVLAYLLRQQAVWQELVLFFGWMLSLLILFFRELYGRNITQLDVMVYVFGTFAGISTMRLWLDKETKWLDTSAVTNIFTTRYQLPQDSSLREMLNVAVLLVKDGTEFYRKLAQGNLSARVKELFQKLANEKANHQAILENVALRWIPLRRDPNKVFEFYLKVKEIRIFNNPPATLSQEKQIVEFAIEQERKLLDFYLSFENAFPELWKRIKLEQIIQMERWHVRELSEI